MFQLIGVICYGFAAIDLFSFYALGYDITGLWFSPWLAGFVGSYLTRAAAKN